MEIIVEYIKRDNFHESDNNSMVFILQRRVSGCDPNLYMGQKPNLSVSFALKLCFVFQSKKYCHHSFGYHSIPSFLLARFYLFNSMNISFL